MRVVMSGGTGLIGTALTHSLAADGHEIVILSRNPRQRGPLPESVRFAKWDAATTDGDWTEELDGADVVVHLAGASVAGDGFLPDRWSVERKRLILNSRVKSGQALVDAISGASTRPAVFIQSSAVGYYGVHAMSEELTEDAPAGSDFLADVCVQWEDSTRALEALGIRRPVIRTGVVLSAEGGALTRMAFPFKLYAGGPLGNGKQPFPWIHIYDEVQAIRFLIENDRATGPFNLNAPQVMTNGEFSRTLGKVLNRPALVPVPGFAFNMMFGEVATILLDGQHTVPNRLIDHGFTFTFPEAEAALRNLYQGETTLATA